MTGRPAPSTGLASPPIAPGALTTSPRPSEVLAYLSALGAWHDQLRAVLNELDRRAQAAADTAAYTGDITLAMSKCESIDRRIAELTSAWDSGRVQATELAHIAQLIWGRLPDALGNPSAFSLSEATTLAAALEARLAARLGEDALAGSGVATRIDPLRDTLARCVDLAAALGRRGGEAEAISAELDALLDLGDPGALAAGFDGVATRAELLERDLIKELSLRSSVQAAIAGFPARLAQLSTQQAIVQDLAQRCRSKIASPPHLAVPAVSMLGTGPTLPESDGEPGTWTNVRNEAAAFDHRLNELAAALAEAERRYRGPLDDRADLRGLLGAYHDRATKNGYRDDPALGALYQQAHDMLWTAPCDLPAGRAAVTAYQQAVLAAVAPRPVEEDRP